MDLPIKHGGSFHSYVKLPEGICWVQSICLSGHLKAQPLGKTCETVCFSDIFQLAHTFRLLAASSHVFQATGLNKLCNPELEWRLRKSPTITNHSTVHLNPRKELTCTCQENCKWRRTTADGTAATTWGATSTGAEKTRLTREAFSGAKHENSKS